MKRLLLSFLLLVVSSFSFAGGSSPGFYYGQVPTPTQWNSYFAAKLDYTPGAVNTVPYWDASGNLVNALISGDCTSVANVFTCTASSQELGSLTTSNSPYIDFHSSGNNINYDSRIIASGGTGVSGNGVLNYYAAQHTFNGAVQIGTATQTAKLDIVNSADTHAAPYTTWNTIGIKESLTNTGTQGGYGNRLSWTQSGVATSGFSIAQAINGAFTNLNGAAGLNLWMVAQTPLTATGYTFGVVASEINPINLYGVPSSFRSRGENTQWVGGIQLVTESHDILTGNTNKTSYPSLFAYAITHSIGLASSGKHQKTANGLLIERDAIYPGGSGLRTAGLLQVSTWTGSISGNTLTLTSRGNNRNQVYVGQVVTGAGVASATITADVSGNGDTGDYTIDGGAQSISSESITLTAPLSDAPNEAMRIEDYWINGLYMVDATFANNRAIMLGNAQYISSRNAANNADVDVIKLNASNNIQLGTGYGFTNLLASTTAPTIASGFGGTSPTISCNGTATCLVTTNGTTGSQGVLTMPTVATGWNCTSPMQWVTLQLNEWREVSSTQTSVTFQNITLSTGAALTTISGQVIMINCVGF